MSFNAFLTQSASPPQSLGRHSAFGRPLNSAIAPMTSLADLASSEE